MNNTKVKICGLTRLVDIESVNEIKPDYVGFVFANKSKRYISPDKAYELKQDFDVIYFDKMYIKKLIIKN